MTPGKRTAKAVRIASLLVQGATQQPPARRRRIQQSLRQRPGALTQALTLIQTTLPQLHPPSPADRQVLAQIAALVGNAIRPAPSPPPATATAAILTRREREVLQLLAEGNISRQIASRLHISPFTVDVHRRHIMDKLELRSIAELTKYAVRQGLTPA